MTHLHNVYDSDARFTINSITRVVKNDASKKTILIQGDHNSERFTFECPRYIEGHDMSECNKVEVHYLNISADGKNKKSGKYTVEDFEVSSEDDSIVIFSWLISSNATKYAGVLSFIISFRCVADEIITYSWNTAPHSSIYISAGIDASETFETEYVDVIEQWKKSVMSEITTWHADTVDEMSEEISAWKETESAKVRGEMNAFSAEWYAALAAERARIDALLRLADGSTTGDAELQDIRIGVNGEVYESAGTAVREQVRTLSKSVNVLSEDWNLLNGANISEDTYVDVSGTEIFSNNFYTAKHIVVDGSTQYYCYSGQTAGTNPTVYNSVRFVTFFDENKNFISGKSYVKEFITPANAKYVCATFVYEDTTTDKKFSVDYITKYKEGERTHHIDKNVLIHSQSIADGLITKKKLSGDIREIIQHSSFDVLRCMERRLPVINFQFDDGHTNDSLIVDIFNEYNMKCGFALMSTISENRIGEYLSYQENGFEILSHGVHDMQMNDETIDEGIIEDELKLSLKSLTGYGFNVRGFVTPYSTMHNKFTPYLKKYYDFGATAYYGEYLGGENPSQNKYTDTYKLHRVSVELTNLENMKNAVDNAINNNGFLTFYGHSKNLDSIEYHETTNNLKQLLSYIKEKVDDLQCVVLTPSNAIDCYFHIRHGDLLEVLNR